MGLDINRVYGKHIRWNYNTLHRIRHLAAVSTGWVGTYNEFYDLQTDNKTWSMFSQYRQLMHFCDAEGVFISDAFLSEVDYSKSFFLGSFDDLKAEINKLNSWLMDNVDYVRKYDNYEYNTEQVAKFAAMLNEEDAQDIIIFH